MVLSKKHYSICCSLLLLLGLLGAAACTQNTPAPATTNATLPAPKLVLSATRIPNKGYVDVKGSGFTPKTELISHLKKPDGSEFPTLLMLTDDNGEITHQIDTLLLMVGTHELWMVDSKTGASTNVAKFDVTTEQPPPGK
jgi:hypothetical protein